MTMPHVYSGKVRDIYDAGDGRLLFVTSDRISAFDVVMAEPIPDKGRVLTAMTAFWLELMADLAPSHLLGTDAAALPDRPAGLSADELEGRVMLVRRADMLAMQTNLTSFLEQQDRNFDAQLRKTAARATETLQKMKASPVADSEKETLDALTAGLAAATGSLTIQLAPAGSGTKLEVTYAVTGYLKAGMNTLAAPVDSVLAAQFARLKNYVEVAQVR